MRLPALWLLTVAALPAAAAFDEASGTITTERWPGAMPLGGVAGARFALYSDGALGVRGAGGPQKTAWFAVACAGQARLLRRAVPGDYTNAVPIAESRCTFQYPRAAIAFRDPALPVSIELRANSFLIPHNVFDSALPAALFTFVVDNPGATDRTVDLALAPPGDALTAPEPRPRLEDPDGATEWTWIDDFARGRLNAGRPGLASWLERLEVPAGGSATARVAMVWDTPEQLAPPPAWPTFEALAGPAVAQAYDGRPDTAYTSPRPMAAAEALIAELPGEAQVQELVLQAAQSAMLAAGFDAALSSDGIAWTDAGFALTAPDGDTLRLPVTPRSARFVKLVARRSLPAQPWSVAEVTVVGETGLPQTPTSITMRLRAADTGPVDHGRMWQTRLGSTAELGEYVLREGDRLAAETAAWQEPILASSLPSWLKRQLLADVAGLAADGLLTADGLYVSHLDGEPGARRFGSASMRLATQPLLCAFYPELDATELRLFAAAGRPERLVSLDPATGEGDGAASLAAQARRHLAWTGTDLDMTAGPPLQWPGAGALAGDWALRTAAQPTAMGDEDAAERAAALAAAHLARFRPVPPALVDSEGMPADMASPLPEMRAWLGGELIRLGLADDGLALFRDTYEAAWLTRREPFEPARRWSVPDGMANAGGAPAVSLSGWEVLAALAGASLDVGAGTLGLRPVLPGGMDALSLPVYFPRAWGRVDFAPGRLTWTTLRTYGEPITVRRVVGATSIEHGPAELRAGDTLELTAEASRLQPDPRGRPATPRLGRTNRRGPGYPTSRWNATAAGDGLYSVMRSSPESAFDGDLGTRWSTGRPQRPGDAFTLDLGERLRLGRVRCISGSADDYPRELSVYLSDDGETWRPAPDVDLQVSAAGEVDILFGLSEARCLRLALRGRTRYEYWSIHELYVFAQ